MRNTVSKERDMTKGNIVIQVIAFSIPLLIGNLFQQFYNMVDSIVVGNFVGKAALAAVGSSNTLINLIVGLFIGISTGASVVISQYYGAKDRKNMKRAVHTAMVVTFVGGIVLIALGLFFAVPVLELMGTPCEVMTEATRYLQIYFTGSLFAAIFNMGSGILRGVGDSKRPLYFLCVSSVVNIVLDLLFVAVFQFGVAGVAYATIIAQGVAALLILIAMAKTQDMYRLEWKELRVYKDMLRQILVMGIPSGIQGVIVSLSNVIVQSSINAFGADAMAGFSSYIKIDGLIILPITSFALAAMTFTGQNIGAKNYKRVRTGTWKMLQIGAVYTLAASVIVLFLGKYLLNIFTRDAAVNSYGCEVMYTIAPAYITLMVSQILTGVFRGAGKSILSMVMLIGNMVGIRLLWILTMGAVFPSLRMIIVGYGISWITAALTTGVYAWKGKWLPE